MGRGFDESTGSLLTPLRSDLGKEAKQGGALSLYQGKKDSMENLLWYFKESLDYRQSLIKKGEGDDRDLVEDGMVLFHLLSAIPEHSNSRAGRFLARYSLLLARDLIRANPALMDEVEGAMNDLYQDGAYRNLPALDGEMNYFRKFFQELLDDDLEADDLLDAGRNAGLEISFLGSDNSRISHGISVDGEEFFVFQAETEIGEFFPVAVTSRTPGVGGNHFQRAPISEVLATVARMSDLEIEINPMETADDLALIRMGTGAYKLLKEEAPAFTQFREVLKAHCRARLEDRLYGIQEDLLGFNTKTKQCEARINTLESLAYYADLRQTVEAAARELEAVDENSEGLDEKDREYIKKAKKETARLQKLLSDQDLGQRIDDSLREARKKAEPYLEGQGDDLLPSAYISFQNFSDALDSLHRSKNLNAAAVWSYLAEGYGSDDPDTWRRKRLQEMINTPGIRDIYDTEAIRRETRSIYGSLLVEQDQVLKKQLEQSYAEEEDLRLHARILGVIPDKELIYMPSPSWIGLRNEHLAGQHHASDPERPSFVFLKGTEDGWREKTVVHELLHAGQRVDSRSVSESTIRDHDVSREDATTVMRSIDEALTETLTQVRMDREFAERTNVKNMPNCSYPVHVSVLLEMLDHMKIPQREREGALEELIAMSGEERLRAIGDMLEKRGARGSVMALWKSLLVLRLDGGLDKLGSYFRP